MWSVQLAQAGVVVFRRTFFDKARCELVASPTPTDFPAL